MMPTFPWLASAVVFASVALPSPILAQTSAPPAADRPFLFSLSTLPAETPRLTLHLDSAAGEGAFTASGIDRAEQRVALHAALGHRLTIVARLGVAADARDARSSQQGEVLVDVLQSVRAQAALAVGGGVRHEAAGVNVLLGRIAAGASRQAWRADGNLLFEKPLSADRDAVDLIVSAGLARRIMPALHAGVEMVGEDLEGFWDAGEAEGGARLLVGPSLRLAPPARRWQVSLAGGPMFHPTRSPRASDAARGLPASIGRRGYAVRAALGVTF